MELKLPMELTDIEACIPHRYPFLLIDRVLELTPKVNLVAIKNCSGSDPILQGHFPGMPVFPGVLMIEALAQASAILGHYSKEDGYDQVLLTEVTSARFRRKVIPGDTLRLEVKLVKMRQPFFWFEGHATVDGETAAKVTFSALMK